MKHHIKSARLMSAIAATCLALSLSSCGSTASVKMMETAPVSNDTAETTSWMSSGNSTDSINDSGIVYDDSASDTAFGVVPNESSNIQQDIQSADAEAQKTDADIVKKNVNNTETSRKLITTVDLTVQTKEFDKLQNSIENIVTSLGGYIQNSSVYNNSYDYYSNSSYEPKDYVPSDRSASYTIRIPEEKLDAFLTKLHSGSNVTRESKSTTDITLDYVDTAAHKRALETEEKSLETMLKKATELDDIVKIQSRLTDVQYQIDSIESQLRTYDNQVDYSTVNLDVNEVAVYQQPKDASIWSRISSGFKESIHSVASGFSDFAIWFIVHIPQMIVAAVFIALAFFIVRIFGRKVKTRRVRKDQIRQREEQKGEAENEK